ncbi:MAG: DUF4956 domain-containing protein [Clostridia bacterium]|nr:DUF4956 domain-containing protein [Clostridia bacterium]
MSIRDTIKDSLLQSLQANTISTSTIGITLGLAIVFGLYIFFIYRITSRNGFYNSDFNKSLATLPVVTAAILLAMNSNLTISLGMVGALSIVRFRNAVKNPSDLTFLFWSISIGIVVGACLYELAIFLCLAVTVLIGLLNLIPSLRAPCLLVVSADSSEAEPELAAQVKKYAKTGKIRSRNISKRGVEWIWELQPKNEEELVRTIAQTASVTSVHLMTHDGNVRF